MLPVAISNQTDYLSFKDDMYPFTLDEDREFCISREFGKQRLTYFFKVLYGSNLH